ncbi:NYN domain-containing protein [Nocardiopsis baichengensis]|uniref:NYN domain-containing protein n=1 Tax=Nocardiopsis baichengensis TaxID=280240 RepID=UPI00034B15FD|nr:NYN domain-containing protein [Nocardiopsis baichengensis]
MEPADTPSDPPADTPAEDGGEREHRPLPEAVRSRVVEYGSDVLGGLRAAELPAALRRVAKFEPRRRARLAGPQIAAQLETDAAFRGLVAARVEQVWPELAEGLRRGVLPPAADPVAVGAAAYLIRPQGWQDIVDRVGGELERQESAREADEAAEALADLRARLDEARAEHREEVHRLRKELREQRSTVADLRRKVHAERKRAKEAEERAAQAEEETRDRSRLTSAQVAAVEAENRRLKARLEAAEGQVEAARRAARAGRSADDARLRVLLDVLVEAAHGLRRELALPSSIATPADLVAEGRSGPARPVPEVGAPTDDPALVDRLLELPRMHLLVDGYNVTKTGYPELPLADQRARLLTALEGLASRTKAEITCVFDGADVEAPAQQGQRRVRLLFSDPGETADELIVHLVRTEPPGRPLAVVTADKEIIAAARREGARPVPSTLLLRRLDPGR